MFYFFLSFCRKIIKIICTILIIVIKDLEVYLNNLNMPLKKSKICLQFSAQKDETDKQTAAAQY